MIKCLCARIAEVWCDSNVISGSDREEYIYGLELLISTIVNLFYLILISFLFGKQQLLIPYLLSFIPVRIFAGGYHARTHWGCVTFTTILYSLALLCVHIVPARLSTQVSYIIALFSLVVILSLSPVAAVNKPLSRGECKIFRRISLIISTLILTITFVIDFFRLHINDEVVLAFLYGEGAAATSLMIQRITF